MKSPTVTLNVLFQTKTYDISTVTWVTTHFLIFRISSSMMGARTLNGHGAWSQLWSAFFIIRPANLICLSSPPWHGLTQAWTLLALHLAQIRVRNCPGQGEMLLKIISLLKSQTENQHSCGMSWSGVLQVSLLNAVMDCFYL